MTDHLIPSAGPGRRAFRAFPAACGARRDAHSSVARRPPTPAASNPPQSPRWGKGLGRPPETSSDRACANSRKLPDWTASPYHVLAQHVIGQDDGACRWAGRTTAASRWLRRPRVPRGPPVAARVDRRLQPFGLTEATWLPLIYLARPRRRCARRTSPPRMMLDGSSVVRLLDALEASALIERARGRRRSPGEYRHR